MPVAKLAGFLDMSEQEFRIQLLVFKHKMKNLVWTSGISALDGEFQSASEVDFYIDKVSVGTWSAGHWWFSAIPLSKRLNNKHISPNDENKQFNCYLLQDMIHIADTKVARRYGDFFIRQIHKFEEVRKGLYNQAKCPFICSHPVVEVLEGNV